MSPRSLLALLPLAALLSLTLGSTGDETPPSPDQKQAVAATRATTVGARGAAQRALDYLATSVPAWQAQHGCYGCHVQAVAAMAFATGHAHRYEVKNATLKSVTDSLLGRSGGARAAQPFTVGGSGSLPRAGAAFGGAALSALDAAELAGRDELLATARRLVGFQREDGAVENDDARPPVIPSDVATTYLAAQTWRQAFATTADDEWLTPLRKAERFLRVRAAQWSDAPAPYVQSINYALLGLLEAGTGANEVVPRALARELLSRQLEDGGWGFQKGEPANAFATGQTLYALRRLGFDDDAAPVARGTRWLVAHQDKSGGWGGTGAGKAEAMWGVMGLVSIDVMSIDVGGLVDGTRVTDPVRITARARDNKGQTVKSLRLLIDDVAVHEQRGDRLDYRWDVRGLLPGLHLVDVEARNERGQATRRRLRVYAGDTFLTEVGSRYEDGETRVSFRNLAPEDAGGKVRFEVFAVNARGEKGKRLGSETSAATSGPGAFVWRDVAGRVLAELTYEDATGRARQTVAYPFVHQKPEVARERYGQLGGKLDLDDASGSANTTVDLVDEEGRVVQSVKSTRSGRWRFKNVDKGRYRVRVNKSGFKSEERQLEATPGQESSLDLSLTRE